MIRVKNINKVYFKNKKNENKVLKDITVDFPDKGLVVLLGKSGSGKTTLLNILSGLDKPNSGTINIINEKFSTYDEKRWNRVRNLHIGFIFQNYKIIEDITVYENIELVLKMIGIEDIDKRISYVLNAVGLNDYEKRLSNALSGGEQQRVSIARALAKDPSIIIADEPTGNLDSKNTVEAMDILSEIANEKLVVMVTHDELLAECYADRIIRMKDGHIASDTDNVKKDKTLLLEHLISYEDYEKEIVESEGLSVSYYSDDNKKSEIEVFKKKNTLYVKSEQNIRLAEDVYREVEEKTFELPKITKRESKSFITFKHSLQLAVKRLGKLSLYNKLLYVTLGLVGIVASISIGLLGQINVYDDSDIVSKSRNYVNVEIDNDTYENTLSYIESMGFENVNFVMDQQKYKLETPKYYQITNFLDFKAHPSDISLLTEENIIYGRYPEKVNEIVMDKMLADIILKDHNERGIDSYEDILHSKIVIQSSGTPYDIKTESYLKFEIVGISNDESPTLWMTKDLMYSIIVPNVIDKDILEGSITIDGSEPTTFRDVLINKRYTTNFGGVPTEVGTAAGRLFVTGTYEYFTGEDDLTDIRNIMLSDGHFIQQLYFEVSNISSANTEFLVYSDNPEELLESLLSKQIKAYSEYIEKYNNLKEDTDNDNSGYFMFSMITIIISASSIYFIIRSSLLSRVYEISVYRALGSTRMDLVRVFLVEIALITTISSILAFSVTTTLLLTSQQEIAAYITFVRYTPQSVFAAIGILYGTNILFGIAPVLLLLRKTPADLFAKYDI